MSDIFKKITSIEPDEADVLDAIRAKPQTPVKKGLQLSSIEEEDVDNDPIPSFITREDTPAVEKIEIAEPETLSPLVDDTPAKAPSPAMAPAAISAPAIIGSQIEPSSHGWMKWAGLLAALIWIAASFSYFYGFFELRQKWTDLSPMQISGLIMAIIFPAILLALLFYALKQLSQLSAHSHRLERAAFQLTQPDETVIGKTNLMSQAIKNEVDSVDARIDQALARMSTLEEVLNERTKSLVDATGHTAQTTDEIASRLSTQRLALESIAGTFDNRMEMLSSSLSEHTTKLDGSTQLAEQKIQEARVSVEGAAERINAASDVVRGNTIDAASTLTKSHEEIENLANMIRERSAELDEVYRKHAQDLTGMIAELRDEQQNLSLSLDERLSQMRDMSLSAKVSAESLTEASEAGKNTVQALAEATRLTDTAVKQRFAEMEDMVKFSNEKAANISDQASQRVQDRLAQTRKEISRIEDDMLALQSRLASPTLPQNKLALDDPKQPTKKRKRRLKLLAVEEEAKPHIENNERPASAAPLEDTSDDLEIPSLRSSLISEPPSFSEDKLNLELDNEYIELASPTEVETKAIDSAKDIIRKTDVLKPVRDTTKKKERSGWRWRDMLGGLDRPDATQAVSSAAAAPIQREISHERMIASLSALGLTPSAIVDDGCIIEATNTRRAKGASAMSTSVSQRIGSPVRHLHRSMEKNPGLKSDTLAYVAQFNTRLGPIGSDREAIRNQLETDAGRAFLLCDAALNG